MVSKLQGSLSNRCLSLYTDTSYFGYQRASKIIGAKAAFAVAGDPPHQACAWAAGGEEFDVTSGLLSPGGWGVEWAKVDAIALSKCERANATDKTCTIILHNNSFLTPPTKTKSFEEFK
jgi:hypothetical protein